MKQSRVEANKTRQIVNGWRIGIASKGKGQPQTQDPHFLQKTSVGKLGQ